LSERNAIVGAWLPATVTTVVVVCAGVAVTGTVRSVSAVVEPSRLVALTRARSSRPESFARTP
jgi:hypothetical protein